VNLFRDEPPVTRAHGRLFLRQGHAKNGLDRHPGWRIAGWPMIGIVLLLALYVAVPAFFIFSRAEF
jgi:hypothetical protein